MDPAWKQAHIGCFISLSGLWGGTPAAALGLVSGGWGTRDQPTVAAANEVVLQLFRGLPVLSWLLPGRDTHGNATH